MEGELAALGLPALFAVSFAAATLAPVGSEWLLAVLLLRGSDPYGAVAVASAGNFLGACTTYWVGLKGRGWLAARGKLPARYARVETLFHRYGAWALLLSWLPLIGDVLCLAAGVLRVGWPTFTVFTLTGKAARYAAVALAVL